MEPSKVIAVNILHSNKILTTLLKKALDDSQKEHHTNILYPNTNTVPPIKLSAERSQPAEVKFQLDGRP